jgi:flagellar motor switch protein FliM
MVPTFDRETRQVAPIIEEMFHGVARRMRVKLATWTGQECPVSVRGVKAASLTQLLEGEAWSDAAAWFTFSTEERPEPLVVALEGGLLARLIPAILGQGASDDGGAPEESHLLTEVELYLGKRIARELVGTLEQNWTVGPPPVMRFLDLAPTRRVCSELDPNLSLAVCTVAFGLAGSPIGSAFVALPASLVKRLLPRSQGGTGSTPERPVPAKAPQRQAQFDRVMPVEVEVAVELARVSIPLQHLEGLRVGDEILIGRPGEVLARIGEQPVFAGEPGASGMVRSVRVTTRMISDLSSEIGDR